MMALNLIDGVFHVHLFPADTRCLSIRPSALRFNWSSM
jgi:hypothetical protein